MGTHREARARVAVVTAPKRRGASVATSIGGILVGFDEQVWNRRPPAQEQVIRTDRATRLSAPGGRTIELPPTEVPPDAAADAAPPVRGSGSGPRSGASGRRPRGGR